MSVKALSAGTLTGDTVRNKESEELGTVQELMIDLEQGRVAYVVMAAGGLLGIGEKYFAVPWSLLDIDTDNHDVVVDLDKETIQNAPGFDKDNWPDPNDVGWLNEVYVYYDLEPYGAITS
jgi:sporulation protein YlmC with PRC-barrel domain